MDGEDFGCRHVSMLYGNRYTSLTVAVSGFMKETDTEGSPLSDDEEETPLTPIAPIKIGAHPKVLSTDGSNEVRNLKAQVDQLHVQLHTFGEIIDQQRSEIEGLKKLLEKAPIVSITPDPTVLSTDRVDEVRNLNASVEQLLVQLQDFGKIFAQQKSEIERLNVKIRNYEDQENSLNQKQKTMQIHF